MEVSIGAEDGFVREWTPCTHVLSLIPTRIQTGIFSSELSLTCVDAVPEFLALGTNTGLVYWYDRKKGTIQRLRCEPSTALISCVKIVNTVDYMVAAGNTEGCVNLFQIPKKHPDNIPHNLKPKTEQKVERYTIKDLHKSKITCLEWSKNGMKLFSGDNQGLVVMTEIDFYMHLCKSQEVVQEVHPVVQLSLGAGVLLVSTTYRCLLCRCQDARWDLRQLGTKERKRLCSVGAVVQHSAARGAQAAVFAARPGLRLWRADAQGDVHQTLLFKEAINNPLTVAELLNPSQSKRRHADGEYDLGPLYLYREHFLVSHNHHFLYILDPRTATAVAVVDDLRRVMSVSVSKEEIFVVEGGRSLVRLARDPDPPAVATHSEQGINLMTKSLVSSLQQVVNTVRDLTHVDQTLPFISSVLEQPISMLTNSELIETATAADVDDDLPPIKQLPADINSDLLKSIADNFEVDEMAKMRRVKAEELQKKLEVYNSIMEWKCEEALVYRRGGARGPGRSRTAQPASFTTPVLMELSLYSNNEQDDEALEKEIEEKEKMLAKKLNITSLSIPTPEPSPKSPEKLNEKSVFGSWFHNDIVIKPKAVKKSEITGSEHKLPAPLDLIPKIVVLPNTWNLEELQLKVDSRGNGSAGRNGLQSPEDSDWEII